MKKSIIVVADTHFGLYSESEVCDPNAFSDFLNWIKDLEKGDNKELKMGDWISKYGEKTSIFEPPEKLIFLGDILELWTSSNEAVFASTSYILKLLSELNCEKIYVLGNHDYDLFYSLLANGNNNTRYPFGTSEVQILEKEYLISKGGENYYFLHGQQFDNLFMFPTYKFLAPIRNAALAFGNYSSILVVLCLANFLLQTIVGMWGVTDIILTILLTVFSIPYSFLLFSRKVWNWIKTIKFNPKSVQEKYKEKQLSIWKKFYEKLKEKDEVLNIVYGHTHTIDNWCSEEFVETNREYLLTFMEVWNIPSWIKNTSNEKESIKNEISHVFLYINEKGSYFFGWDKAEKKPYFIPKEIVQEKRKNGNLSNFEHKYQSALINKKNLDPMLTEIDWPVELINKWKKGF